MYAHEFFDVVALRFEKAADFAFFAMMEVDFQAAQVVVSNGGCGDDFFGFEQFPFVLDAVEQGRDVCFVEFTVEKHAVALDDTSGGMGQLVGEVTVVGQNEQAFAFFIESTGAEHSLPLKVGRKQVEDGAIRVGVGVGAEKALRFVHGHGNRRCFRGVETFVFNKYFVSGKCFVAEANSFAIDADRSVFDQALGFAA